MTDEPRARRRILAAERARLRDLYETTTLPVAELAALFGVSAGTVRAAARTGGWAPRAGAGGLGPAPQAAAIGAPDRSVLVDRLFAAVERQVIEIERRFAADPDAAADEKDARTLATLARTLELLVGLEKGTAAPADTTEVADADVVRRELARRIEALCGGGEARPRPGEPRPG